MIMQQFLVYISLFIAVGFLLKKFFWKKKTKKSKTCGDDCACH
ncbi:MAG TPA: FeoB-associated Cys-rich membrane protein [Flavobacterium sp.]|nr:FeoB-associated Cys-rich membrane protein [Flavobacterium sp.]